MPPTDTGRILIRSLQALVLLLLLAVAVAVSAPYTAAGFARVGLTKPAETLYAFAVRHLDRVYGGLVPDWAFTGLAELRPQPDRLIQIAQHARRHRPAVALALYERAIPKADPGTRFGWLQDYAALLAPTEPQEAANAHLAAADIALRAGDFDAVYRNFEAAIGLHDDGDIAWKEAQLLLARNDQRAAGVLRRMIERRQHEVTADYALGLLLWRDGSDPQEAYAALRAAAADDRYRPALQGFVSARTAADELEKLQNDEHAQNDAATSAHDEALAQHRALYERLRRFQCDVRQWSDWESHTDQQLQSACRQEALIIALSKLAALAVVALLPELLVARVGAAAELGALEGRALSAEAAAAARAGATAEESYAFAATRPLRNGGTRAVETSIEARKRYAWKMSLNAELTVRLDAEQAAIVKEIEIVLEFRRTTITKHFRPLEERAQAIKANAEGRRDAELAHVQETEQVVRVKLARIPLDAPLPRGCRDRHDKSASCAQDAAN